MQIYPKSNPAVLTPQDVHAIVRLYQTGTVTQADIARAWGLSRAYLSRLLGGQHWWYVSGLERKMPPSRVRKSRARPTVIASADIAPAAPVAPVTEVVVALSGDQYKRLCATPEGVVLRLQVAF